MRIAWMLPPLAEESTTLARTFELVRALRVAGNPAELHIPASPDVPDADAARLLLARAYATCVGTPHMAEAASPAQDIAADATVLVRPSYLCAFVSKRTDLPKRLFSVPLDIEASELLELLASPEGTPEEPEAVPEAEDAAGDTPAEDEVVAEADAAEADEETDAGGSEAATEADVTAAEADATEAEAVAEADAAAEVAAEEPASAPEPTRLARLAQSAPAWLRPVLAFPGRVSAWLAEHQPWTTYAKYLFALVASLVGCYVTHNPANLGFALLELAAIALVTEALLHVRQLWGQIANDVLMALFDLQVLFLVFSRSYITLVMLTNVTSLEDLGGKAVVYLAAVVVYLLFCSIPVVTLTRSGRTAERALSGVLALELVASMALGGSFSPLYAYPTLAQQKAAADALAAGRANASGASADFYVAYVVDHLKKPAELPEQPNVILIMTEGLSANVIDDPRGIMPNVAHWRDQSLSFDNYYNHTFATYRGIIGQLYSGYQLDNLDTNSLVSIQSVFSNKGYRTSFLNVEPDNAEFTGYLGRLGFDEVVTDREAPRDGYASSISDAYAYKRLYELAEKMGKAKEPFFLATYTLGTHVSFDSVGAKFGNGSDAELNKFFEADQQFGAFMDKLVDSDLAENTVVVFTTDHASYADLYYQQAFPGHERTATALDEIPLFVWWLGVKPEVIDVDGRNSLDLAPTILDYLDMSTPNYFLGTSLFAEGANDYDTLFFDTNRMYTSKGRLIDELSSAQAQLTETRLQRYFAAASTLPTESETAALVTATREAVIADEAAQAAKTQAKEGR